MDEAWLNAPSLEMDAWFLEILIIVFEKMIMIFFFFEIEWGMAKCP